MVLMLDWNCNPKCLEYDDVGINLVQMRHPGTLKAYVRNSNAQMKDAPKMNKFYKNYIILGGILKVMGEYHIQISKIYRGRGRDHQNC